MKAHPVRCDGAGGRTPGNPSRPAGRPEEVGNIYDNFSIDYEYPGGVHMYSSCRHIPQTPSNVSEHLVGHQGRCHGQRATRSTASGRGSRRGPGGDRPVRAGAHRPDRAASAAASRSTS